MGLSSICIALGLTLTGSVEPYQPRQPENEIRLFERKPDSGGLDLGNAAIRIIYDAPTPKEAKRFQECAQLPAVGAFVDYCSNTSEDLITPYLTIFNAWENYAQDGLSRLEKNCKGNYRPFPIKVFSADGLLEQGELDLFMANCSQEYKADLERDLRVVKEGRRRIGDYAKNPVRNKKNLLNLYERLQQVK